MKCTRRSFRRPTHVGVTNGAMWSAHGRSAGERPPGIEARVATPRKSNKAGPVPYYDAYQNRWCGTVTLPPVNGKRRRQTVTAKTEGEAAMKLAALQRQLERDRLDSIWGEARRREHPSS